jgi:cell division protein FtsN
MNKKVMMGAALATVFAMTSCKSSESAYKKAYEKAKAQSEQNVGATEVTPVQTTQQNVSVTPVDNTDYSNVAVRTENVTVVTGNPLKSYSVVIGAYSIKANADRTCDFIASKGYQPQIVMNQERGLYRVVAFTSDSKAEAARTRDVVKNLRSDFAEAWLLYQK